MFVYLVTILFSFSSQDTAMSQSHVPALPAVSPTGDSVTNSSFSYPVSRPDSVSPRKKRKIILKIDTIIYSAYADSALTNSIYFFHKDTAFLFYFRSIQEATPVLLNDFLRHASTLRIYNVQQKRKHEQRYWIFYVMLIPVMIFAYVRLNFYKYLQELQRSFFNLTITQQFYREHELSLTVSALLLNINFILAGGMYLYLLSEYFYIKLPFRGMTLWLVLSGMLAMVYMTKYIALRIVSVLLPVAHAIDFYNFNVFLFNKMLGLTLIVWVMIIAFANILLVKIAVVVSLLMVACFFIYRFLRGLVIAKDYLVLQKFHFFLYLCTLEIAPAFILIKLLMGWINR